MGPRRLTLPLVLALAACDLIMPPPAEVPDPVYMLDPGAWYFYPDTLRVGRSDTIQVDFLMSPPRRRLFCLPPACGSPAGNRVVEIVEPPIVYKCLPGEITMAEVQARMPGMRVSFCRDLPPDLVGISFETADMIPCSIPEHLRGGGVTDCATATHWRYSFDVTLLERIPGDIHAYRTLGCGLASIRQVLRPSWRDQPPLSELIPRPTPLVVVIDC
ncbi:MAG: hypothetical protein OXN92_14600 [Gammaproteobacteria bacterium]|nr:hypothetical protein [Gammaproteobacteria bacterium]